MNNEKEKFSDGTSMDASKMSKEEKINAIEYWCEGNQQLKQLLLYLNERNIETIGCCSGHEEGPGHELGLAYVAIKLETEHDDEIIDLLAKLESEKTEAQIAFIRGEKCFIAITAKCSGNNEKFFENINQQLFIRPTQENVLITDLRKKYEMLRIVLTDSRGKEYIDSSEYSFDLGDTDVRACGHFSYGESLVYISMEEIERMGKWLTDNPKADISGDFYGTKVKRITYPIEQIKEKCRISKLPLNVIKEVYESVKNAVLRNNGINKFQEESVR